MINSSTKVLITGGSGLIGSRLTYFLRNKGVEVIWLSRDAGIKNNITSYKWDYTKKEIDANAFADVTHIIHLAGSGVFDKPWTRAYKQEIEESRIETTRMLFDHIDFMPKLTAFISGSAIGIYGNNLTINKMSETSAPGSDFLSKVSLKWEQAADLFQHKGVRTVKIRIGIVLSSKGGALKSMLLPVRLGLGSPIASGKQFISWIHIDDLCCIFIKALEDTNMQGPYNAVAPEPKSNKDFMKQCADTLKKPFFMPPVPAIILKLMLGNEKAKSVTEGICVSSEKIQKQGYEFRYPDLKSALGDLIL